jgi:hypothetical protein
MHKFLRRPQVQAATGLPTSTLYDLIGKGEFPRPVGRRNMLRSPPISDIVIRAEDAAS